MLKGIRVIDFSQYLPGPNKTLRLAELGAEIIKLEPPSGDPSRFPAEKNDGIDMSFALRIGIKRVLYTKFERSY